MDNQNIDIMRLVLAAVACCGCIEIDLLSEMIPIDDGEEDGAAAGASGGQGAGGDNAPPAQDPSDKTPPALVALACSSGERSADGICVAEGPVSATLRFATNEPAVIDVKPPSGCRAEVLSGQWSLEHHVIVAGLPQGTSQIEATLADINGNEAVRALDVDPRPGPPVALTEVYADPWGPEPAQEFVEIVNIGEASIDLSGWMIDDEGDANGDLLPEGTVLGPGQVALLVAPSFDPTCPDDPLPAAGALIVYLDSSIGTNGLKNTEAETVELYDALGTLVSSYGGEAGKPAPGVAAFRVLAEIPEGNPWAWARSAAGGATPGTVPTVE